MSCFHKTVTRIKDIDKCLNVVDICNNVMECICCLFFLEKHKEVVVDKILEELQELPYQITKIRISLNPLPENKYYYSFDGINTILYNLFKSSNKKYIKSLEREAAYLKVYYERNSLFTIPVIQIEVLFFKRLNPKTIDELLKTLRTEILYFTSSIGDIDIIEIESYNQLAELLTIPLIVGHPEFKKEGVLNEHRFSQEQIQQMNYLHSFSITKLDMRNVLNNSQLELFENQIKAIKTENEKNALDVKVDDELIETLFEKDDGTNIIEEESEFEDDELPF